MGLLSENEGTENLYWYWIKRYLEWNANVRDKKILFSQRNVERFIEHLKEKGYAGSTINTAVAAIRKWGLGYGYTFVVANKPPVREELPEMLSETEVKTLIENTADIRDRSLYSLLFDCGLRIGEALVLNVADIDLGENTVFIKRRKKTENPSVLPFGEETKKYLELYLAERKRQGINDDALFVGRFGRLTHSATWKSLNRWSKILLGKHIHPHQLRHACAIFLRKNDVRIEDIRSLLGHRSDNVIYRYARMDPQELKRLPPRL